MRQACRKSLLPALLFALVFTVPYEVAGQDAATPAGSAPRPSRTTSEPYTGDLSIFDSPGRDQRLQIGRVLDTLAITTGKSVADIGAGSGWFSERAARRVGNTGLVYAVDINPEAVRFIDQRARRENLRNVRTILSRPDDPRLPPASVDAVLLLKTYHEVAAPVPLLEHLRAALRPGARVGIIDRNGNGANHGVNRDVVVSEAAQAGYHLAASYDFVKGDQMDYFLVFTAQP
jgi:SAM-dependent methyltransferase